MKKAENPRRIRDFPEYAVDDPPFMPTISPRDMAGLFQFTPGHIEFLQFEKT